MRETVDLGDRKVTVLGTAHVSEKSKQDVIDTIDEIEPDLVGVELDQNRFDSLRDKSGWKDLDLAEAIRQGKGGLLFFNLLMSIYQRRIGLEEGSMPGEEMMEAVGQAEANGINYALIDRDISETLERIREELTFWEKFKLLASFFEGDVDVEVEDLTEEDMLGTLVKDLGDEFPSIKRTLLDERNSYMMEKLLEEEFEHAVVVVGAAHVEGMVELLREEKVPVQPEEDDSWSVPWFKAIKYGIPTFVILGLGYSFYQIGFSTGVDATAFWIVSNGFLAMLGAIIARSHPLTWAISFAAAPLTSLDPALGAGMVASYAEGKFYPPKVEELESAPYITEYRDLWGNQVGRILLTFVFVTVGSAAATFISAGYILSLISTV